MRHEWITVQADSFCASVRDGTHDSPKPVDVEGRRLITSKHITGNRLDIDNAYQISEEDFAAIEKRSKVDRWDVLITMIGTVGEPCLVSESPDFAIKNIGLFKSRGEIQGKYLYYYLKSPLVQHHIKTRLRGTTQQYIPLGELRKLPVKQPASQSVMRSIVEILSSLDDKIELNRQINATLESMAQALFKSWFVDFDPVIDNALAAGNPIPEPLQARAEKRAVLLAAASAADTCSASVTDNAHPTQTAPHTQPGTAAPAPPLQPLPADLRALFPDSFVFNEEMGWVPEGWEVEQVGELLELAYGKALAAKNRIPGEVPVYGSGGVSGFHNEAIVAAPGIIVGRKGTVGSLYWVEKDFFPIDTVFYVKNKSKMPLYWLYRMLATLRIENMGADSAVPGVNRNVVCACKVIVPSDVIADLFGKLSGSFNSRRSCLSDQNQYLSDIRDSLLPKLLSGQIQLPEVERKYAEAAQ